MRADAQKFKAGGLGVLIFAPTTDGEQAMSPRLLISAITGGYQAVNRLIKRTLPDESRGPKCLDEQAS
ncbi:MAG: hypothetical protein WAV02_00750 [Stellaceae bacterium]